MRKYYSWNIALIIVCFVSAFCIESYLTKSHNLTQYAHDISKKLSEREQESDSLFSDNSCFFRYFAGLDSSTTCKSVAINTAKALTNKSYTFAVFKNDTSTYISTNDVNLDSILYVNSPVVQLNDGYYVQRCQTYSQDSSLKLCRLIRLKKNYNVTSKYLDNAFSGNVNIPGYIQLSTVEPTPYVVKSNSGLPVAYLTSDSKAMGLTMQIALFLLYIFGFISTLVFVHKMAKMIQKANKVLAVLFIIFMFIILNVAYYYLQLETHFPDITCLKIAFVGPDTLRGSLASVLVNIFILLWIVYFFYAERSKQKIYNFNVYLKYPMSVLEHFLIVLCGFMTVGIHRHLVQFSTFDIDFDNVFDIDTYSMTAIFCILLVWFIYSIFVYHTTISIRNLGLSTTFRSIISPMLAIGLGFSFLQQFGLGIDARQVLISVFFFIVAYDYFIGKRDPILGWGICSLLLYSVASATLLNTYKQQKDYKTIREYVNNLDVQKDSIAEVQIKKIAANFENTTHTTIEEGTASIKKMFNSDAYLPDHYELTLRNTNTVTDSSLRNFTSTYNRISYIKDISNCASNDSVWYRMEVTQLNESSTAIYHDDLFKTPMKEMQFMNNISFAIYKDDLCINKSKNFDENDLVKLPTPEPDYTQNVVLDDKHYYIGHFSKHKMIYVCHKSGGIAKGIYLVSHLFVLMLGITAFLWLSYKIFALLLGYRKDNKFTSLRLRIQGSFVGLCLISGIVLAIFSMVNSDKTAERNYQEQTISKARSVKENIKNMLSYMPFSPMDSLSQMTKIINDISVIHNVDIDLYGTDGRLLVGMEKDIFRKGILAKRMNNVAFLKLMETQDSNFVNNENIGNLAYKTAYFKVFAGTDKPVAYAAMPQYRREQIMQDNRADSIGLLLTTYILLLIPALVLAYNISKRITQPIKRIGDAMALVTDSENSMMRIEDYSSNDELGIFVQKFNTMVDQIGENNKNVKSIAQLESWKDMARLVAHDIKNPLSPLKLSIQYLQAIYKRGDAALFEQHFNVISNNILQQIAIIITMVEDFTSINTPRKVNADRLSVNSVLEHVSTLYQHADENVFLDFTIPEHDSYIYADRSQITRIFDNLVKNGIQAVQAKEISGRVTISTYGRDKNMIGIKVSDTGKGIPKDNYGKVFLPSFTTKTSGSGIGLAVCKNMVTAANGNIRFESEEGIGTDFYVEFPTFADVE